LGTGWRFLGSGLARLSIGREIVTYRTAHLPVDSELQ
jgi:hypothetical protein